MIRIVKSDAQPRLVEVNNGNPFNCVEKNVTCYDLEDTVLIDSQWRPEDWNDIMHKLCYCNPESECERCTCQSKFFIQAAWSACLEALERKAGEK